MLNWRRVAIIFVEMIRLSPQELNVRNLAVDDAQNEMINPNVNWQRDSSRYIRLNLSWFSFLFYSSLHRVRFIQHAPKDCGTWILSWSDFWRTPVWMFQKYSSYSVKIFVYLKMFWTYSIRLICISDAIEYFQCHLLHLSLSVYAALGNEHRANVCLQIVLCTHSELNLRIYILSLVICQNVITVCCLMYPIYFRKWRRWI